MRTALVKGAGVLVPSPFQQLFGADHPVLGGDEDFQHGELPAGERDVASVAEGLPAEGVEPQTRDLALGSAYEWSGRPGNVCPT